MQLRAGNAVISVASAAAFVRLLLQNKVAQSQAMRVIGAGLVHEHPKVRSPLLDIYTNEAKSHEMAGCNLSLHFRI